MTSVPKERLDKILADRGCCESRSQAQALIMGGKVKVNGQLITKPGTLLAVDVTGIEIAEPPRYVSRGGLKLEKALFVFGVSVQERVCIDIGASTGGFTDCLLQHGAAFVMAVDVGHGQLDWKLRSDNRVQTLEKTNIRELTPGQLHKIPTLGVVDTSFISLKKVLPPLSGLLGPDAEIIALLKPQFEYRDYIDEGGFKGVVRDIGQHRRIVQGVLEDLRVLLPEWRLRGFDFSPITGPKGNIEFLLYLTRGHFDGSPPEIDDWAGLIDETITKSYNFHA